MNEDFGWFGDDRLFESPEPFAAPVSFSFASPFGSLYPEYVQTERDRVLFDEWVDSEIDRMREERWMEDY